MPQTHARVGRLLEVGGGRPVAAPGSSVAKRPNIVVILLEDLCIAVLGYCVITIRLTRELEEHLLVDARQVEPAESFRGQPAFLVAQAETVFDSDFEIDDGMLPHEQAVLPSP